VVRQREAGDMHLSDHDLRQLDDAYVEGLSEAQARALLGRALADLKAARERLGQNPGNSSRPPSTRAPWEQADAAQEAAATPSASSPGAEDGEATGDEQSPGEAPKQPREAARGDSEGKRPGRRKGAPGHRRTQHLPVDVERTHAPDCCAICGMALTASYESRAHNARYERLLRLWVFTCATATLFIVGRRSREVVRQVLGDGFRNWLMSDGFWAYRDIDQRLRCLAHLIRKAHGLEDSLDRPAQRFGTQILQVIATVTAAVYKARGGAPPEGGLRERHAPMLNALLDECLRQRRKGLPAPPLTSAANLIKMSSRHCQPAGG
jgi:hypothetical protein